MELKLTFRITFRESGKSRGRANAKQKGIFTDIGPVDLLCRDANGIAVAVEIKRKGGIDGVEQLARYLEYLNKDPKLKPVRGIFAAQQIAPQAKPCERQRN